jgi:hypothetical protein
MITLLEIYYITLTLYDIDMALSLDNKFTRLIPFKLLTIAYITNAK